MFVKSSLCKHQHPLITALSSRKVLRNLAFVSPNFSWASEVKKKRKRKTWVGRQILVTANSALGQINCRQCLLSSKMYLSRPTTVSSEVHLTHCPHQLPKFHIPFLSLPSSPLQQQHNSCTPDFLIKQLDWPKPHPLISHQENVR